MPDTITLATAPLRALAVGQLAQRALEASRGLVAPIAEFPDAPYLRAGEAIVWIGVRPRAMHPRMVVLGEALGRGQAARIDADGLVPWQAPQAHLHPGTAARLAERAERLRARLPRIAAPRGFGAMLSGRKPAFPLELAAPRVQRLAGALRANDHAAMEQAALALLGIGSGLTPSGDDLVGGACFARRLLAPHDAAFTALGERLVRAAATRTHVISAALFADLVHGATYGLLHDVLDALLADAPLELADEAVRALVSIGHSSGWDMLTGVLLGLTGKVTNQG
jgi:hypothetical protein